MFSDLEKMKKFLNTIICTLVCNAMFGQVEINTPKIWGSYHIDAKNDNPKDNKEPDKNAQKNDIIILDNGNMGIGTITPTDKLVIKNEDQPNTGLQLRTGAGHGNILMSDIDGDAVWAPASNPITILDTPVGKHIIPSTSKLDWKFLDVFNPVLDEIKAVYGNEYGWDTTNKLFRAPKTGNYRITLSLVYGSTTLAQTENWRIAVVLNNIGAGGGQHSTTPTMSFISVSPRKDQPQNSVVTGILPLQKGDFLQVKGANFGIGTILPQEPVTIIGGPQETIWTIEML